MFTIYSQYNVLINYSPSAVQVIPAPFMKNQLCGVCANFDGNKKNAATYLFAWRMNGTRWKTRDAAKLHIDTKPEDAVVDKVHKQCFL